MQRLFLLVVIKIKVILFFILLVPSFSFGQPPMPTQQQINELLPNGVVPTQMTKSGFDSYFQG
jgi:hypothetical protein